MPPADRRAAPLDPRHAGDGFVVVEEVRKSFGSAEILRGIDLRIARGEVVCIIGPSGSGKSTLLKCINGLERTSSGRIVVDGQEVTAPGAYLPKIRQGIGMVFQGFNLFPHLTVIENVVEGLRTVKRVRRDQALARGRELLAMVGLGDKETAWPAKLSGGQKQRVAIARALAMDPKLMLFDEPTSALDPELVNEVLEVMGRLARNGMTMIIVTHEIHFAERVAHRVVMIDHGTILESAPPAVLLKNASHPRTRTFLQQLDH